MSQQTSLITPYAANGFIEENLLFPLRQVADGEKVNWHEYRLKEKDQLLQQQAKAVTNYTSAKRILYISLTGNSIMHTDDSDETARLLVVTSNPLACLMVQSGKNIEVTRLIPGYVYQFSDYLPHVVVNPPEQTIELITLDKFDR